MGLLVTKLACPSIKGTGTLKGLVGMPVLGKEGLWTHQGPVTLLARGALLFNLPLPEVLKMSGRQIGKARFGQW